MTTLSLGEREYRQLSAFAGHWTLVQQWLEGLLTWGEMIDIATGKTIWQDTSVHSLFRSVSNEALTAIQKASVPYFIGADGIEVSFSSTLVVFPLSSYGTIIGYIYDDGPLYLQYTPETDRLDTVEQLPAFLRRKK